MTSSTLHSEPRVPLLALALLSVAVATWAVCAAYTLWVNPEVRFYKELATVQDAWSSKMDREHGHKVVVFGGSSCMFSVNGEQMLKDYRLPTVNRGLAAGMAVKIPTLNALEDLKKGDTLILALEPAHFTEPIELTSLATQFSYARGHSDWATRGALGLPGKGRLSTLLSLHPGSRHALTMVVKVLQSRPLYRYKVEDASPSGWMQTDVRLPVGGPPGHGKGLSDDARRFLSALHSWCEERGVRVAYSLPWGYSPASEVAAFKRSNADFLMEVMKFMPVIKDPALGVDTDASHFADTAWHLNEVGSHARTDRLGGAVRDWNIWSLHELQQILSEGP